MLDIQWVTIIWEIINFLIITVVLYFLVFKPIVKRSKERAVKKARLMDEMMRDRDTAATRLEEINTRLTHLDTEIEKITDEAYEQNKKLQMELLQATREEAAQILQDALLEVHKEQFIDMKQHQNEIVDTILEIAGQALRKVAPPSVHSSLIDELTKKIWDMGKTSMHQVQTIRESVAERQAVAYITSPQPLTGEQEMKLVRTFSALVDGDVNLDLKTDERLIAGIKVRIGDLVIENSLMSQFENIREEIAESIEQIGMDNDR